MKILHILDGTRNGGVPSLVYELSRFQRNEGHNVDIYSFRSDNSYFDETGRFEKIGVNIIKAPSQNRYSLRIIRDLINIMPRYDIVHVHLFPQQLYASIAKFFIKSGKRPRFITTEHSTWNNRRKYSILKYLDRLFYNSYGRIVCISSQTEVALKTWLNSPELNKRILTISNGINLDKYFNSLPTTDESLNVEDNGKIIAMVSRMEEPKDPLTLVRAIALCPDNYYCVFIGSGKLTDEIDKLARKLKVNNRIKCLGNRNDVPEILKKCDVGILSTNWEGFGLVAIEYMAAGLPCLVSDVEGLREVVGDPELLFPVGDSDVLSQKIQHLLSDENYRQKKIDYGINHSKKFSSERMNQYYLNIYNSLLNI